MAKQNAQTQSAKDSGNGATPPTATNPPAATDAATTETKKRGRKAGVVSVKIEDKVITSHSDYVLALGAMLEAEEKTNKLRTAIANYEGKNSTVRDLMRKLFAPVEAPKSEAPVEAPKSEAPVEAPKSEAPVEAPKS